MPVNHQAIRLAGPSDARHIITLIDAAYRDYVPRLGRNPQPMGDDYAALIEAGEVWVLYGMAALDGVLVVQKQEDCLLIRTVGIAPNRQRQGLGSRLMAEAKRMAMVAGIPTLRLYTNEAMTGNFELYERLGYAETQRKGPEGKQVIYMTKELK